MWRLKKSSPRIRASIQGSASGSRLAYLWSSAEYVHIGAQEWEVVDRSSRMSRSQVIDYSVKA